MNETTPAATFDLEGVAEAARLVAPVNGASRSRRAAPPRPPSAPDAASLRAWEAAAEQLEPDWATPVEETDAPIATEPAGAAAGATEEPMAEADDADDADSVTDTSELDQAALNALAKASVPDSEPESALDALAKSVTKPAHDAPRIPALARSLPPPPPASRIPLPPPPAMASRPPPPKVLPPPSRTPLPPLVPPPASQRPSPLPPAPPISAVSVAAPASIAPLSTPSLVEIRHSPVARRYYAQLGVAAALGALLTIVLFALLARSGTSAAPATSAAVAPSPPPLAPIEPPAPKPEQTAEPESIPPPPVVANLSVDDLAREAPRAPSAPKPAAPAATTPAASPPVAATPAPVPPEAATPEAPAKGLLQISADPPANVAIDGRPVGMTPKTVRLSSGVHRVALIGPQGRRSQTVNVTAGKTTSVAVKF